MINGDIEQSRVKSYFHHIRVIDSLIKKSRIDRIHPYTLSTRVNHDASRDYRSTSAVGSILDTAVHATTVSVRGTGP